MKKIDFGFFKTLFLGLAFQVFFFSSLAAKTVLVPAGTLVILETVEKVAVENSTAGRMIRLRARTNVIVDGYIVVLTGAMGLGRIKSILKKASSPDEEIYVEAFSILAVDGQQIALFGSEQGFEKTIEIGSILTGRVLSNVKIEVKGKKIAAETNPDLVSKVGLTAPIAPILDTIRLKSSPSGIPLPQKRIALLIGNQNYAHAKSLDNPSNDVAAMRQAVLGLGFEVLFYENLGVIEFMDAVNQFRDSIESGKFEVGMFYYSGHGMEFGGRNYLIPTDAVLKEDYHATKECVDLDEIEAALASSIKIIVLDACRDNPFAKNWRRRDTKPIGGFSKTTSTQKGIITVYATAAGSTADDRHPEKSNGLFTGALVDCLNADCVAFPDVFFCATEEVSKVSQQVPFMSASIGRRYYLRCQ